MRKISIVLSAFILIGLFNCAPKKSTQSTGGATNLIGQLGEYKPVTGPYGGVLRQTTTVPPKTFNLLVSKDANVSSILSSVFEGLTEVNGVTVKVQPLLSKSWDVSPDGLEWVFHLREDVKWFDGKPFTADDVVFTFNDLIFNDAIASSTKDIMTIGGKKIEVTKVDTYTVKFKLAVRFAPFAMAMGTSIFPKHALEKYVKNGTFNSAWSVSTPPEQIVGTGPYMLERYVSGQKIILKRNPNYWKVDEAGNKLPYLGKLEYMIVQNADVELLKFEKDEIDFYTMRGQDYPILKPKEKEGSYTVYNAGPNFGSQFLVINENSGKNEKGVSFVKPHKLKWFTNLNFRKALAYAIDRKSIINVVMNGLGFEQWGPLSPSAGFFFNPNTAQYSFDPEKAKALLKLEGFVDRNNDGFLEDKEGNPVEFNIFTNADNTVRKKIGEMIRKDFEDLGVKVYFTLIEFNTLVTKLNSNFDFDVILIGLTGGIEPHFGANVWNSSGELHMWYPNQRSPATVWEKEVDEIFEKGVQELDPNKRKVYYDRWQNIISDNVPVVYTALAASLFAVKNKFGNLYPTPYGGAFHNLDRIFIKQ